MAATPAISPAPAEKLADSVVDASVVDNFVTDKVIAERQRQLAARTAQARSKDHLPVIAGQRFGAGFLQRFKTALIVLALALVGMTLGIYGQQMLPQAAALIYGTGAPTTGLLLENISTRYEPVEIDGVKNWQLVIEGSIKNQTSAALAVPPVVITLQDASGATLAELQASVQLTELAAGAVTSFVQTVDAVPAAIAGASVAFKNLDE